MIEEDVIEKHNGVYGGKSHIFFLKGFDLTEGLEYLKNSLEGSWDNCRRAKKEGILRYVASIKVSNVSLKNAFEWLACVLNKFKAFVTDLEIENCIGNSKEVSIVCLDKITYFAKDFFIHCSQLIFRYLASIMYRAFIVSDFFKKSTSYNLSRNIFVSR